MCIWIPSTNHPFRNFRTKWRWPSPDTSTETSLLKVGHSHYSVLLCYPYSFPSSRPLQEPFVWCSLSRATIPIYVDTDIWTSLGAFLWSGKDHWGSWCGFFLLKLAQWLKASLLLLFWFLVLTHNRAALLSPGQLFIHTAHVYNSSGHSFKCTLDKVSKPFPTVLQSIDINCLRWACKLKSIHSGYRK